jgi:hypothetical protein
MQLTEKQKRAIENWVFEVSAKGLIETGEFGDDFREAEAAILQYVEELRERALR